MTPEVEGGVEGEGVIDGEEEGEAEVDGEPLALGETIIEQVSEQISL